MVVPIIVLVGIPIFLGIVYMPPFDMPVEEEIEIPEEELRETQEESNFNFLYFVLLGIWTLYLIKIIIQVRKGSFRITQRY